MTQTQLEPLTAQEIGDSILRGKWVMSTLGAKFAKKHKNGDRLACDLMEFYLVSELVDVLGRVWADGELMQDGRLADSDNNCLDDDQARLIREQIDEYANKYNAPCYVAGVGEYSDDYEESYFI